MSAGAPVRDVATELGGEDAQALEPPVPLQEERAFPPLQAPMDGSVRHRPSRSSLGETPQQRLAHPLHQRPATLLERALKPDSELGNLQMVPDGPRGTASTGELPAQDAAGRWAEPIGVRSCSASGVNDGHVH